VPGKLALRQSPIATQIPESLAKGRTGVEQRFRPWRRLIHANKIKSLGVKV
jgi:hypothetical protein